MDTAVGMAFAVFTRLSNKERLKDETLLYIEACRIIQGYLRTKEISVDETEGISSENSQRS